MTALADRRPEQELLDVRTFRKARVTGRARGLSVSVVLAAVGVVDAVLHPEIRVTPAQAGLHRGVRPGPVLRHHGADPGGVARRDLIGVQPVQGEVFLRPVETAGADIPVPGAGPGIALGQAQPLLAVAQLLVQPGQGGATLRPLRLQRRIARFQGCGELVQVGAEVECRGGDERELTMVELVREASHPHPLIPRQTLLGELYARLSRALILPVLPLLAVPLGLTAKRGGRAPGIFVAGLMLLIFQYLIDFGQGLASTGRAYALPAVGAPFFTFTKVRKLKEPTYDVEVITQTAYDLFLVLDDQRPVRLLGVRGEMVAPEGGY